MNNDLNKQQLRKLDLFTLVDEVLKLRELLKQADYNVNKAHNSKTDMINKHVDELNEVKAKNANLVKIAKDLDAELKIIKAALRTQL